MVDEPRTEFRWFFLKDAEGEEFTYTLENHRRLASCWLGQMHVSAEGVPAVSRLPDRGPQHYLDHLHFFQQRIQDNLSDSVLNPTDVAVLESILLQAHLLDSYWTRVVELCCRYPKTLVHCDFASKNLRVRSSIDLVAFDWEMAG